MPIMDSTTPKFSGSGRSLPPNPVREFLLPTTTSPRQQRESGKELFRAFVADFLDCDIPENFLQAGFAHVPDQIILLGPCNSHLCIPVSTLTLSVEDARSVVQAKIKASQEAFAK